MLILGGCASGPASPGSEAPVDVEASHHDEPAQEGGGGAEVPADDPADVPADVPAGLPMPDYAIVDVIPTGMGGHVFYMRGTDIEADAETLRSMLLDAGFEQMAWGLTEERGANGIFVGETITARILVHDVDGQIEIEYGYNPM